MKPTTRRNVILAAFLGVSLLIPSLILFRIVPHSPRGQQSLVYFEPGMLPIFRDDFNRASDAIRVVVFLSPSSPDAADAARSLQSALAARPALAAKVFLIWQPVSASDKRPPPNALLSLVTDPRVSQFADAGRVLSQQLKPSASAQVYPAGARWLDNPPRPVHDCPDLDMASCFPQ